MPVAAADFRILIGLMISGIGRKVACDVVGVFRENSSAFQGTLGSPGI
jgi:hypothetical protein